MTTRFAAGAVACVTLLALSACSVEREPGLRVTAAAATPTADAAQPGPPPASQMAEPPPQEPAAAAAPAAPVQRQLPGGRGVHLAGYTLVGYTGIDGTGVELGKLGVGALDDRVQELVEVGRRYGDQKAVIPTVEFIATVVHTKPGADGMYRTRATEEAVQRHLDAARRVGGILLLQIQPGRSDFVTEVKAYETFLKEPDVGVALDPEWRMGPGEVPLRTFGHVTGGELDAVAQYLSGLVRDGGLPEKVMLYHQLRVDIVRRGHDLKPHPGLEQIVSVDGIGTPAAKRLTWTDVVRSAPAHVKPGIKLFYLEDAEHGPVMTPEEVTALRPKAAYVMYE